MSTQVLQTNGHVKLDTKQLLGALRALRNGNFAVRLPIDMTGIAGEVSSVFNEVADLLQASTAEIERVSQVVGKEGNITNRASVPGASGGWAVRIEAIN